jgi:ferrous iron transport protein B
MLINNLFSPLTSLLGLPLVVGTTLIFGVLRKELSMLMLIQALGTVNVVSVMSTTQIMTFTIFIIFYIPCVATIAVLWREIGSKRTLLLLPLLLF